MAFSPQANYTNLLGHRSWAKLALYLQVEDCGVVSVTGPTAVYLGFIDWNS
jgi:hypothetical protein